MTARDWQSQVDAWLAEYGVPGVTTWAGYAELKTSSSQVFVMGRTQYKLVNGMPCSDIYLQAGMSDAPEFFQRCVIWHEFSHAYAFQEDGVVDSHNARFYEIRRKKPVLWLGDCLLKVLGIIWCRRRTADAFK